MSRQESALNAFIGLTRTTDILEQIAKEDARKHQLNITEFAVLELLFHKGPQQVQHIRKRVLIASSSITYVVDCLVKKQLVNRVKDDKDKRVFNVALTAQGIQLMEAIFPQYAKALTEAFATLNDDELAQLNQLLKKVSTHAQMIEA